MNSKKSLLMGAAVAGLMISCTGTEEKMPEVSANEVMCYGVNSCKGQGACHGKVDACNGKNGCQAETKCGGQNSCKGKGLIKLTKEECEAKGGKVAQR